jgi:hypothetical protein
MSEDDLIVRLREEREQLAREVIEQLRVQGVPEGAWLLDIEEVRRSLHEADELLRRLKEAIIRAASSAPSI